MNIHHLDAKLLHLDTTKSIPQEKERPSCQGQICPMNQSKLYVNTL